MFVRKFNHYYEHIYAGVTFVCTHHIVVPLYLWHLTICIDPHMITSHYNKIVTHQPDIAKQNVLQICRPRIGPPGSNSPHELNEYAKTAGAVNNSVVWQGRKSPVANVVGVSVINVTNVLGLVTIRIAPVSCLHDSFDSFDTLFPIDFTQLDLLRLCINRTQLKVIHRFIWYFQRKT